MSKNATREEMIKKLKKEDKDYLDSGSRVVKRFAVSIIEYIVIFLLIAIITNYASTGSVDFSTLPKTIQDYLKPGGVLFMALIGFLPIMVLENVGIYYGLGTIPRMAFGVIKCFALVWFINMLATTSGNIDIIKMSGMAGSSALKGLESFSVNIQPMAILLEIIFAVSAIIPIAEYFGARKKHLAALERKRKGYEHCLDDD